MHELRDTLTRLDAAVGDGDLGITASKGATAVREYVAANEPGDDLGKFLAGMGMAFNRAAPGTMGTLIATALMRAGKEVRGRAALDAPALARMLEAADMGIQERGKAKPGDKTVIDALHPAAEAFSEAVEQGEGLSAAGDAMLQAAREGRDAIVPLRSQVGRASWVGERTENQPDPGAVLGVEILEAIAKA
jgi:dihydroxyacetone kinase